MMKHPIQELLFLMALLSIMLTVAGKTAHAAGPAATRVALAQPSQPKSAGLLVNSATVNLRNITREQAIDLFFFYKRYWDTGNKVAVILPPFDSISFKKLAMVELRVNPQFYHESILAKFYGGIADPIFVTDEAFVAIKVANTLYSVGYYYDTVTINTGIGVRVLPITDTPSQ